MNATTKAVIDAEIAQLTRVVDPPSSDPTQLGWGRDLSCVLDCDERLTEVDPLTKSAIGQALIRRLITPRGGLWGSPNYGYDVRGLCNSGVTPAQINGWSNAIEAECQKDERVEIASCVMTWAEPVLTLRITVTPVDYTVKRFDLVFSVTDGQTITNVLSETSQT